MQMTDFFDALRPQNRQARNDLALDQSGAELVFPDGTKEGQIHAQSMETQHLSYNSVSYPLNWTFSLAGKWHMRTNGLPEELKCLCGK